MPEVLLSAVAEALPDALFIKDLDGRYIYINSPAALGVGLTPSEMMGRTDDELFGAEAAAVFRQHDLLAMGSATPTTQEEWARLKNGREVVYHATKTAWRDEAGHVRGVVGISRDITSQVAQSLAMQAQLEESERQYRLLFERFRALFENATELTFILDGAGNFTYLSDSFTKVLGYRPDQLLGHFALDYLHPDDVAVAQNLIELSVQRPDELQPYQIRGRHCSGGYRIFEGVARNLLNHPQIQGIVVNARDITEERKAELTLQLRDEELRQAQKMEAVGRLAGGIAHDFNNVLTAITGHAEFLAEMFDASHAARADIEAIRHGADRAARLTRQLLAFSRRQVMHPAVLDLRSVALDMQGMLERLLGERVQLNTMIEDAPLLVEVDRAHIEQVILNLAVNARDAMPEGGALTIELSLLDVAPTSWQVAIAQVTPGRYVQLCMIDEGVGISAEALPKIFDPFFTTKERGLASGMGLSTAYGIVKQSGGFMLVESQPGRGTRFDVLLRSVRPADTAPDAAASANPVSHHDTVLLVEDEPSVRQMAERVLRRYGFNVLVAGSGAEALAILAARTEPVPVVVTDVVMPRMSGRELAAELARSYPDTRIIFMSGYTNNEINEEGIVAAQAAYLPKPFTPAELAAMVRAALLKQDT